MSDYIDNVISIFESGSNPTLAPAMKKYMKGQFEYLGIKRPQRDELQKQIITELGYPSIDELENIVLELWEQPEREYQYFAIDLLVKLKNKVPKQTVELYKTLLVTKSWWDTVDTISVKLLGVLLKKYPELEHEYIDDWSLSDNIWLKRSALLYQLKYKKETNLLLLDKYIQRSKGTTEFFLNKAIGWVLREYTRTDAPWVQRYVAANSDLSNLSKREALRLNL